VKRDGGSGHYPGVLANEPNPEPSMSLRWLFCAAMSTAILGACATEDLVIEDLARPLTCTSFGCPDNSPYLGDVSFHELHRAGLPNEQGLSIVGFFGRDGRRYQPDVRGDRLVALELDTGAVALEGDELLGAIFDLEKRGVVDTKFFMKIVAIGSTPFTVSPHTPVPTYQFVSKRHSEHGWSGVVCEGQDAAPAPAILFAGDRYAADRSVTVGKPALGWFNMACQGNAAAKLHLMRYTGAGQDEHHPTTVLERQTMLRLLTATYCPAQPGAPAKSYTVSGEPLLVEVEPKLEDWPEVTTFEAVWNHEGVVCLEEPRLASTSRVPQSEADLVLADLEARCGRRPPRCSELLPQFPKDWPHLGTMLSANRD
jgi:hypothetical protein